MKKKSFAKKVLEELNVDNKIFEKQSNSSYSLKDFRTITFEEFKDLNRKLARKYGQEL